MMTWLLKRLQEPSTWRGIVWLLTVFGVSLKPEAWEYIMTIGMAIAGLLGVLSADTSPEPTDDPQNQIPPIELQGKPEGSNQPQRPVSTRPPIDRQLNDQFSGGWGDR